MTRVLLAGDGFMLNSLLESTVKQIAGERVEIRALDLPWPAVPFGPIAEVDEASGDEQRMVEALHDADVCLTQMGPLTREIMANTSRLRLFAVGRGGPVNVNVPAATERGIAVTFTPGRNATATAEYTLALMLAAMRRIPATHQLVSSEEWPSHLYSYDAVGMELEGTTVGLVGAGAVGGRVARLVHAFGARVLVHDPHADPSELAGVARFVDLDGLLAESRVVSLHARATAETAGLIGRRELGLMPPGSVVVNCARGSLLDYGALAAALQEGHLFAAGLDVFDAEPLPADSPLRTAPNVVMTPHLAGASRSVAERAVHMVVEELRRYLAGEPYAHCVNPGFATRSTP